MSSRDLAQCVAIACGLACGCSLDEDNAPRPNSVHYELDGVQAVVVEGLSFALVDDTKHVLADHSLLYVEAGSETAEAGRILGDKLRIAIPTTLGTGEHPVRFAQWPTENHVWVQYRRDVGEYWTAYDGSVIVDEIGGAGSRLRIQIAHLRLTNECGQLRTLRDGSVDMKIGGEDSWPEVEDELQMEWEEVGASAQNENNLVIELDERSIACSLAQFVPMTFTADESGTGNPERVLEITVGCGCGYDPDDDSFDSLFYFGAYVPAAGSGEVIADGVQHSGFLLMDEQHTPFDFGDDEHWMAVNAPVLEYHDVDDHVGATIDIELVEPLDFVHVVPMGDTFEIDFSQTKTLSYAHAYGRILSTAP